MNEDYLVQGEKLAEFLAIIDRIIDVKVSYKTNKLDMAEDCIEQMRVEARLLQLKARKLKGSCCDE